MPPDGGDAWLRAELHEALAPFGGETQSVSSVWFKEGVAHIYQVEADWVSEAEAVVERVLGAMRDVAPGDRAVRTPETAKKLHEYADRLARHPRFPEAGSHEKREFMAGSCSPNSP